MLQWAQVSEDRSRWAFGNVTDDRVSDILAYVTRRCDGSWGISFTDGFTHATPEPSRLTAQIAAERALAETIRYRNIQAEQRVLRSRLLQLDQEAVDRAAPDSE